MALTVGELVATITVNDRDVRPALRRTEQALRQTGQQLGSDAGRAGQQAGQQLGGGFIRGADGQWRNLRGELVDATTAATLEAEAQARRGGQQAGRDFTQGLGRQARQAGDELGDGVRRGGGEAEDAAGQVGEDSGESFLSRLRSRGQSGIGEVAGSFKEEFSGKLALAAVGTAAAGLLIDGFNQALEQQKIVGRLGAQLGATGPEAQRYGHVAGRLYANAVTEDFQGAADAISATMRAGIAPPDATEAQLESLATKVQDLSSTFDLDLGQTANAVGQILKNGLAKDGTEALDAITAGLQRMGPRADDIADTFNEYSTIFRQMGLDASTATGLLSQGLKAGARDTDVVADSLKEFVLITQKGGKTTDAAFQKIGLSGKEMQKVFSEGGPKAEEALDKVFDKLRAVKDPTDRAQLALALFGTKAEDTQKALFALDPSNATKALGEVGGAADRMGDSLRDNAATKVEQFKRRLQQNVVDFLGSKVIPALTGVSGFVRDRFSKIWAEAGKGADGLPDRILNFVKILGSKLASKIGELAPKAIEALSGLGQKIADYVVQNPESVLKAAAIVGAFTLVLLNLPELLLGALAATAGLIIGGFIGQLINILREKLPQWWDAFTGWVSEKAGEVGAFFSLIGNAIRTWFSGLWSKYISGPTSRAWSSFLSYVQGIPARTVGRLAALGSKIAGVASRAWQSFRDAASRKVVSFLSWAAGLPGRIKSKIGSLNSLLWSAGRNVITGLWNGISSLGGWLWTKVKNFVSSNVVGAAKSFLHIGSPSKLMASAVGRWIPAGVAKGIEDHAGVVDDAMSGLVTTPTPSASFTAGVNAAAGSSSGRAGAQPVVIQLRADGSRGGAALLALLREAVKPAGGNVQFAVTGRS